MRKNIDSRKNPLVNRVDFKSFISRKRHINLRKVLRTPSGTPAGTTRRLPASVPGISCCFQQKYWHFYRDTGRVSKENKLSRGCYVISLMCLLCSLKALGEIPDWVFVPSGLSSHKLWITIAQEASKSTRYRKPFQRRCD